ncbi:hypothetical protein TNCV_2486811 [Trichonephila clavipes]|uniref:Uncharacterized protein n=1 Tax=Trichonephila clavipes TaxID=2585209 RepID=A0A8X7BB12_TRICX|nr:hypothetical protein TNCV_2486811 [Trichonephila clavipes]
MIIVDGRRAVNIKCVAVREEYVHREASRRTGTRLKRRCRSILVFNIVVGRAIITVVSKKSYPLLFAVAHPVEWLATLTSGPLELGSSPGEDMDVCGCIVHSLHGGTLNSRRAANPLLTLV